MPLYSIYATRNTHKETLFTCILYQYYIYFFCLKYNSNIIFTTKVDIKNHYLSLMLHQHVKRDIQQHKLAVLKILSN